MDLTFENKARTGCKDILFPEGDSYVEKGSFSDSGLKLPTHSRMRGGGCVAFGVEEEDVFPSLQN